MLPVDQRYFFSAFHCSMPESGGGEGLSGGTDGLPGGGAGFGDPFGGNGGGLGFADGGGGEPGGRGGMGGGVGGWGGDGGFPGEGGGCGGAGGRGGAGGGEGVGGGGGVSRLMVSIAWSTSTMVPIVAPVPRNPTRNAATIPNWIRGEVGMTSPTMHSSMSAVAPVAMLIVAV